MILKKCFSNEDKSTNAKINSVVAVVFGFIFIASTTSVDIMIKSLDKVIVILLLVIAGILLLSFTLGDLALFKNKWLYIIAFFVIAAIFITSMGFSSSLASEVLRKFIFNPVVFGLALMAFIVWLIIREPKKKGFT